MKRYILLVPFLFFYFIIQAQETKSPNFAFASHPMFIENISISTDNISVKITIENKITEGNFCVDKNTYIHNVLTDTKLMLLDSENIAVCPETHNFSKIGEKLTFQLNFPNVNEGIKYMNIIEGCYDHCFSIFGIILDPEMNNLINNAFVFFDNGDYESSKNTLLKTIKENPDYPFGFLYLNLIQVLVVQNKIDEAREYYQFIENSDFADKKFILDQLYKEAKLIK